jgi:hypothetical protein
MSCYRCSQPILENPLRFVNVYCIPKVGSVVSHPHYHPTASFLCLTCKVRVEELQHPLPLIQCGDCGSTFYDTFYESGHLSPGMFTCGPCKKPVCEACFDSRHLGKRIPHSLEKRARELSPKRTARVKAL